jgi:hypothetical protein
MIKGGDGMDKRILEMCKEIDAAKLATAQEGVTVWAEKLLDDFTASIRELLHVVEFLQAGDRFYDDEKDVIKKAKKLLKEYT